MICFAFSTMGKTYLTKGNPGKYFDLPVIKFNSYMGYRDGAEVHVKEIGDLAKLIEPKFDIVFTTLLVPTVDLILIPSYGIQEFARRLSERYGENWQEKSDEWKHLGGDKYIHAIRKAQNYGKLLGVPTIEANTVAEGLKIYRG